MTEQPLLPTPDEVHESSVVVQGPARRNLMPWLYGLGFLILAVAIFYVWQYPATPGETASDSATLQAVEQRLADVDARLTRLEQQPAPDLAKISARIDALDGKMADQTQLASRVDALSGRVESLSGRDQSGIDAAKQQLDALTTRVTAIEKNAGSVTAVTNRLSRIAKLQEASFALAFGRPMGDLPNAPEALARYAHAAPPTEAQLRARFARDEQTALAAKQPDESGAPFVGRVWDRAQGLITIRRGDDVIVGNPAAVILSHAQAELDAGDISSAISAVQTLTGQPLQAMATWLDDAKGLVGARSALVNMAGQA